jgi:molecular chaperone DnaK
VTTFVGIDLGTTNSSISTFDGTSTRTYKSPEQNDVTPSALYFAKRGGLIVGQRAYESAARDPGSSAMYFKRILGSSTPVRVATSEGQKELSAEECSAEVLKALFAYLPEETRKGGDIATVITVPAAFNTMQREATMNAAHKATLGRVRLMQEPVAAVMSVMRGNNDNGTFLVFDLGGGTLDIAIAESTNGRVTIQWHGGVQMLGGRDFDRILVDNVVKPWLRENFDLRDGFSTSDKYKALLRTAAWSVEKAKIELSSKGESVIALDEQQVATKDESGADMYVHIPLFRETLNALIEPRVLEAIDATRKTLSDAHLQHDQVERIVFVGGPTNYAPLRERVVQELGIKGSTEVNPMTAVSEGAAIFAESTKWEDAPVEQAKPSTGNTDLGLVLKYENRTADKKTLVLVQLSADVEGYEISFSNLDNGWVSGRLSLKNNLDLKLDLPNAGDNHFRLEVVDASGLPIAVEAENFVIKRTAAVIDSVPASHRVGLQVQDSRGNAKLLSLIDAGEPLPKSGRFELKALEAVKAGEARAIRLRLWEGEIDAPVEDNRPVGMLKISGADFDSGEIGAGSAIFCEYTVKESGEIFLDVEVPAIQGSFNSAMRNLYSREDDEQNFESAGEEVERQLDRTSHRIQEFNEVIAHPDLGNAIERLSAAGEAIRDGDVESIQAARELNLQALKTLAAVTKENPGVMLRIKLANLRQTYATGIEPIASEKAKQKVDLLFSALDEDLVDSVDYFDEHYSELKDLFNNIWFSDFKNLAAHFYRLIKRSQNFSDKTEFNRLASEGEVAISSKNQDKLTRAVLALQNLWPDQETVDENFFLSTTNVGV